MDSNGGHRQCREIERQQHSQRARRTLLRRLSQRHRSTNRFDVEELEHRELLMVPGELLAEASAVADPAARDDIAGAHFTIEPVEALDGRVARLCREDATRSQIERLRETLERRGVETSLAYFTPNKGVMKAEATPETAHGRPWQHAPAPQATQARAVVSVLDTGVALCGRRDGWLGGLESPANVDPLDVFPEPNGRLDFAAGHGTFVAGLYQQVDDDIDLRMQRVLDSDGLTNEVDIACALVETVRADLAPGGRLVVNLSLGTDTVDDLPPLALRVAHELVREIEADTDGDVMLVAAAGNDGAARRCWPAAFAEDDDKVVAVAALDTGHEPASWSTRGPWVTCSTVGESVVSTFVTGKEDPEIDPEPEIFGHNAWASWTGTSFAAPQVAARIASIAQSEGTSLIAAKDWLFERDGFDHDDNYGTLLRFSS